MTTLPQIDWNRVVGFRRAYFGSPLDNMQRLGKAAGDIAGFTVKNQPAVLVNTPALVREVLVTRAEEFLVASPFSAPASSPVPMFQSDGGAHRRRRKRVLPAFQPRHFAAYAETIAECADRLPDRWRDGETVPLAREMERLAFDIIVKTLLGLENMGEGSPLGEAQRTMARSGALKWSPVRLSAPWLALGQARMGQAHMALVHLVHGLLRTRREAGLDGCDMVSILLRAQAEEYADAGMTPDAGADDEFVAQILGVLYAGTINFAESLVWALYRLAGGPEWAAAVRAEAQGAGREALPGFHSLPGLSETLQVYRETLRDMPRFGTFQRWVAEETDLGGFLLPRGARLCIFPYLLHHDPQSFPEPHTFDPGRFAPGWEQKLPRHAYLPFGDGVHVCIGSHFTLMEAQIVLAVLARRLRFEIAPRQRTGAKLLCGLRPRHEFYMRVCKV